MKIFRSESIPAPVAFRLRNFFLSNQGAKNDDPFEFFCIYAFLQIYRYVA